MYLLYATEIFTAMGIQVLMAASIVTTVFRNTTLCSLAEEEWPFRGAHCLHQGDGGSTHL
jgi:hypothetical protein